MNHPRMAKPVENMEAKNMFVKLVTGAPPPPKYVPVHSFKPSPLQKAELGKGRGGRPWVCKAVLGACTSRDAHYSLHHGSATILQRKKQTERRKVATQVYKPTDSRAKIFLNAPPHSLYREGIRAGLF